VRKGKKAKKARKGGRKGGGRKSRKRSLAAKKAARTRREKKEARRAAGRKAARSRKRKGGGRKGRSRKKNPIAAAPRKKGKKKGAKKGKSAKKKGGKKGKKGRSRRGKYRSPEKVYEQTLLTQQRCEKRIARLKIEQQQAIGKERERKARQLARLEKELDRNKARQAAIKQRLKDEESGRRSGTYAGTLAGARRRRRRKNPINPIDGFGEHFAGFSGVVVGALFTVGGDRFAASHPLTAGSTAGTYVDSPAQGDIYDVNAASLPLWSNFTTRGWRRLLSAAANIVVPMFIGSKIGSSGGKTFFQLWGYTAIGLTAAKVAVDTAATLTKSTMFGMRLFAPESTATSARTASLAGAPAAATVTQGSGFTPALTGYGRPRNVGAANGCNCGGGCSACAAKLGAMPGCPPQQTMMPPQSRPPVMTNTPMPPPGMRQPNTPQGGDGNGQGTGPAPQAPPPGRIYTPPKTTLAPPSGNTFTGNNGQADIADQFAGGGSRNVASNVRAIRSAPAPRRWA
jgi:hypothetical protein